MQEQALSISEVHRIPTSARRLRQVNVGTKERWWSGLAGTAMVGLGLARRGVAGWLAVGVGADLVQRGITGHCVGYRLFGVNSLRGAPWRSPRMLAPVDARPERGIVRIERSVTVSRPPESLWDRWRDLGRLPEFMPHVERVDADDRRAHWVMRGPLGIPFELDTEIVDEAPGQRLAWRTIDGAPVEHVGVVTFTPAPGGRGTEVKLMMDIDAPGGRLGKLAAKLFGKDPEQLVRASLRRFKQLVETGTIPSAKGPSGRV